MGLGWMGIVCVGFGGIMHEGVVVGRWTLSANVRVSREIQRDFPAHPCVPMNKKNKGPVLEC